MDKRGGSKNQSLIFLGLLAALFSSLQCCFSWEDQTLQFVSCYIKKLYTGRYGFSDSTGSNLKPQNCLVLLWVNCKLFPAPLTMWQLFLSTAKMWSFFVSRHFFSSTPPQSAKANRNITWLITLNNTQKHPNKLLSVKLCLIFVVNWKEEENYEHPVVVCVLCNTTGKSFPLCLQRRKQ